MMTIKESLLTPGAVHGRPGNKITPEGVVVHYVGNAGSTAAANRNYFENGSGGLQVSAHYVVGLQGEVLRCVPENEQANHAGKSYGTKWDATAPQNNKKYIGIETCHSLADGKFGDVTYYALVELCADIFRRYDWTAADVDKRLFRHYDVCGKSCPLYYVNNPAAWDALKTAVKEHLNAKQQAAPLSDAEKLRVLIAGSSINSPQYWLNALTSFRYFSGFVGALWEKYEKNK